MINLKIKSIWQGKVGIRDKYVNQALKGQHDICLTKGNDIMILPYADIQGLIVGKSEFPMRDRYSRESHYLIYFNWKPTTIQKKLFSKVG